MMNKLKEILVNIEAKYLEIFEHIKEILAESDKFYEIYPFRKRSEHIWRVFIWANRLINNKNNLNKEALLMSTLFHDTGYAISLESRDHAVNSEIIFRDYCKNNNILNINEEFISYLIKNHSNKNLMENNSTPIELILLMEADILDETGAMAIVWDCMAEGGKKEQSFFKTYEHINNYTKKLMAKNNMVTKEGKKYWKIKQNLVNNFIKEFAYDLGIEDINE